MAQGKAWDKEKVVELLRPYFILGYTINKACTLANFPRTTFQEWHDEDEELRQKVLAWQGSVSAKAREQVANAIKNGDMPTARWWLERQEKDEFSARSEHTGDKGGPIQGSWLTMVQDSPKQTEDEPTETPSDNAEPTPGQEVAAGEPVQDHQQGGGVDTDDSERSAGPLPAEPQQA